jgi:hypothetical protein
MLPKLLTYKKETILEVDDPKGIDYIGTFQEPPHPRILRFTVNKKMEEIWKKT